MKPKVFITGGSGLLALNWALALRDRYDFILSMHDRRVRLAEANICRTDLSSVKSVLCDLEKWRPDIVVHAAGLTSVEKCQLDENLAHYVNVNLAVNVAKACSILQLPLVHISTDHLFAGELRMQREDAPVAPLNVYAKTKAEAENRVLDACGNALVVRTNFYGWGTSYRQSFSDIIIKSLRLGRQLTLFKDVFYTPIIASELARSVHSLVDLELSGIFHVVSAQRLSKYDFGIRLAEVFNLDSGLIKPGLMVENSSLVCRPLDMSLSSERASKLLGRSLGGVVDDLRLLLDQELAGNYKVFESL